MAAPTMSTRFSMPPPRFSSPGSFRPGAPRGPSFGYNFRAPMGKDSMQGNLFDGKRMRNKAILRRTVDYNATIINYIEARRFQRDERDRHSIMADPLYCLHMLPPPSMLDTPMNCVTTRFVRTSTNKIRCPIFCVCWTPEGRRLITGASSGEFTLWNGLTFNFETILQAHDTSVRAMVWGHNDQWMLTADHGGFIKYWQSNMNNVKMYQAHKDPIRGLSFCPTDQKFASCSDDGTVRIWDFLRCHEERILRGHGADVKCIDWHPQKALLASGSKDTQQPLKLWDPRMGESLATIHAHKHTVMEVKWNRNGNWLLTASRDHLLKLFDVRNMKEELQSFKGHKKEATTVAWHPIHESLFASGGSDGAIMFWMVGNEKEVGSIDEAHETMVWSLAWHPLGHILVSGSNDHTTKFWTRNRPGDRMRDKYNLNTLPAGISEDMLEYDNDFNALPGMGLEYGLPDHLKKIKPQEDLISASVDGGIPGLDFGSPTDKSKEDKDKMAPKKKVPYAKPVPQDFQQAWTEGKQPLSLTGPAEKQNGTEPPPTEKPPPVEPPQNHQGPPPGPPHKQGPEPRFGPPGPGQGPPPRMGPGGPPRLPGSQYQGPPPRGPPPGQDMRGPPPRGPRPRGPQMGPPLRGLPQQGGPRGLRPPGPRGRGAPPGFRQQGPGFPGGPPPLTAPPGPDQYDNHPQDFSRPQEFPQDNYTEQYGEDFKIENEFPGGRRDNYDELGNDFSSRDMGGPAGWHEEGENPFREHYEGPGDNGPPEFRGGEGFPPRGRGRGGFEAPRGRGRFPPPGDHKRPLFEDPGLRPQKRPWDAGPGQEEFQDNHWGTEPAPEEREEPFGRGRGRGRGIPGGPPPGWGPPPGRGGPPRGRAAFRGDRGGPQRGMWTRGRGMTR